MQNGREVKIALVVAMVMITICLVAFVSVKSKRNVKEAEIEVFKLYETTKENGEKGFEYHACGNLSTDEKITIMNEVDKAYKLEDNDLLIGKQIEGYYKVIYNKKIVAFDAPLQNDKVIYREDKARLYNFDSALYDLVKNICE